MSECTRQTGLPGTSISSRNELYVISVVDIGISAFKLPSDYIFKEKDFKFYGKII